MVQPESTTGTSTSATSAPACSGSDLDGTFAVVRGSAGAGHVSYVLKLENTSDSTCFVTGIPDVRLLEASGNPLPTHVSSAHPGEALAAKVALAPGETAQAEARFSPDVTGVGDRQNGQCQPKAASLRVSPSGGGTLDVPVQPPTPVCEQGALSFDLLSHS